MRNTLKTALFVASILGVLGSSHAQTLFSLKIGPSWPQGLLSTESASWDAGLDYGMIIDKKVGFGLAADFLWNVRTQDTLNSATNTYFRKTEEKSFMFPIMGFFFIDPVPKLIVHPVARFQIGYNSMIRNVKTDSTDAKSQAVQNTVSPYFYGLIIKVGADALYNIGENSSLFLGMEYQWADTRTNDTDKGFNRFDMSGVGIKAGFRIIM